jgi:hypothetical protein
MSKEVVVSEQEQNCIQVYQPVQLLMSAVQHVTLFVYV